MTDLHIARLRKRYSLPATARDERARLDRVLAAAIDEQLLDAALERAGVPAAEEICIRSVASVVRLRRSEADARLEATWSIALAEAIARRLRDGGPDVVRYGSRHQALAEMMRDASRGDVARAWAWRRLGIWTAGDALPPEAARCAALAALAECPHAAAAVLYVIAGEGRLPALLAGVPATAWMRLAREALIVAGASERTIRVVEEELSRRVSMPAPSAERIAGRSVIARALRSSRVAWPLGAAAAFGALALLECEPELAAAEDAEEFVRAIAAVLVPAPVAVLSKTAGQERRSASRSRVARERSEARTESENGTANRGERAPRSRERDDTPQPGETQPAHDRARGQTASGGLLFLLHLVRALGIPDAAHRDASLAGRPLRWVLHQLALALAPVAANDPAALAFAGLAPASRPPSAEELPAGMAEGAAVQSLRGAVVAALRARLDPEAHDDDAALLARVVPRSAEIVSDPAWIEVRFALADAAVDVRRAGLDLDLGWLPWLGVVVRFVYA